MSAVSRRAFLLAAPGAAILARASGSPPAFTHGGFVPSSVTGRLVRIGRGEVITPGPYRILAKSVGWRITRASDDSQWDEALGAWIHEEEGNA